MILKPAHEKKRRRKLKMAESEKWTCSQANEWYEKQPWLRGCNYMPADCANRIDQWQALDSEKHFETAGKSSLSWNRSDIIRSA